jgi:photosystem II stability/assembly factor-like uncharacterized protein
MTDARVGYAVCGDGMIVKTTDGGNNWFFLTQDSSVYCRSVEFIDSLKGFVGGFPSFLTPTNNILRMTTDGGVSWSDLTSHLDARAHMGICGLAIPDLNTIYGCGNWYQDSAYIVKSNDGGSTWSFIDMKSYASSLIDMYFINKDTGFATGTSQLPLQTAIILYTVDGGANWTTKFQNTIANEYCWKIQHVTDQLYFASIEDETAVPPRVLKSTDGGMTWTVKIVSNTINQYNIEGIGFIDSLTGWTGGGFGNSFESVDGGDTWTTVNFCDGMNRLFKVNDSLMFATGMEIWKYSPGTTGVIDPKNEEMEFTSLTCSPNPASETMNISLSLKIKTHVLMNLIDINGKLDKVIDNSDKRKSEYNYSINVSDLPAGAYYLLLKTHEDKKRVKLQIVH